MKSKSTLSQTYIKSRNSIMAVISISNLRPTGADLFDSSESYLQDLTDTELNGSIGGGTPLTLIPLYSALAFATYKLIRKAVG
jgi:hypothetical protein